MVVQVTAFNRSMIGGITLILVTAFVTGNRFHPVYDWWNYTDSVTAFVTGNRFHPGYCNAPTQRVVTGKLVFLW